MAFDSKLQRRIMGCFATGVTVVTTLHDGAPWGMTANAVTSLSLDPPLVLVAVGLGSRTHGYLREAGFFAVNILSAQQESLSTSFAMDGTSGFAQLELKTAATGAPILVDALGYVDCRIADKLRGGDHDIYVGEILAGEHRDDEPLVFFGGKYRRLAP